MGAKKDHPPQTSRPYNLVMATDDDLAAEQLPEVCHRLQDKKA